MSKQKKLKKNPGNYLGFSGVNEFEGNMLPTPEKGPHVLDNGFDKIYNFDVLKKLIPKHRRKFRIELLKLISNADFDKIELGLKSYVKTATKEDNDLEVLKASIIVAFESHRLLKLYSNSEPDIKEFYSESYFENLSKYHSISSTSLINSESLINY